MSTMTDNETYNGYANRETWAFNLHWQNDQGLYAETLAQGGEFLSSNAGDFGTPSDSQLGEAVVSYWRDAIDDWRNDGEAPLPQTWDMFDREVGSWWRIDYAEVGEAVRESLDAESSS